MPADDAARLTALYDAHAGPVWRYVVHLTGDRTGADDVVQETLLRAWRSPRILEQDPATTRSWLFTVARHLVVDEAQELSRELLEQVRLLTNLETNTQKLLQIVLLGQPELRHMLARPALRQLAPCAQASRSTQAPISAIRPVSSSSGMNSSGCTTPSSIR